MEKSRFKLPKYSEKNLSPKQIAENLADYFCSISQEFDPICVEKFSPTIKQKLIESKSDLTKPVLEDWYVYNQLKKAKKPKSTIPGDLPVKIVKEFTPELAEPVAKIFNSITQTGEYPRQWVIEYQLAIPKVCPPESEK